MSCRCPRESDARFSLISSVGRAQRKKFRIGMALSRNVARTCIATSARGDAPLRHFELPYAASSEFPSVVLSEFNTVLSSAIDTPPYCPPNSNDGKPSPLHKLNDKCPVWRFAATLLRVLLICSIGMRFLILASSAFGQLKRKCAALSFSSVQFSSEGGKRFCALPPLHQPEL